MACKTFQYLLPTLTGLVVVFEHEEFCTRAIKQTMRLPILENLA